MKKTLLTLALGLAMALTAATAQAITLDLTSAGFIGSVDPGSPADDDSEVDYINTLIDVAAGDDLFVDDPPLEPLNGGDDHFYDRTDSTFDCSACPDATVVGDDSNNDVPPSPLTFDVTGFTYLLAKYGNTSYVWYVGDLTGDVTLNSDLSDELTGDGLSHYSLYNPGTVTTPDGGTTLSLLGLAMLGLGYVRRHMA